MNIILIHFELDKQNSNSTVINTIKNYSWAKITETTWAIKTNKTVTDIRDIITSNLKGRNKFMCVDLTNTGWASYYIPEEVTTWMKN